MKPASSLFAACLLAIPGAFAAEQDFSSPYDTNPRCTERTYDGNAPECVIQDEGTPRQLYPPGRKPPSTKVPPQNPPPAGTPPAATEPPGRQPGAATTPGSATSSGAGAPSGTSRAAPREGGAAGRSR